MGDGSGSLTWEEFGYHLQDPRVQAYLATLELDVSEARGVFDMLDFRGIEEVSVDDFVAGCMKLKGQAKSMDVCTILYENRKMANQMEAFTSYTESQFQQLLQMLSGPITITSAAPAPGASAPSSASNRSTTSTNSKDPSITFHTD